MVEVLLNPLKQLLGRAGLLLLLVCACYLLALKTDPASLRNDTVHYVSGARNVLAGRGISSNVAYYDLQHRLGHLPVPITDWPPGVSLLIAVFIALGFDGFTSALMVNYLCLFLGLGVVYRILKLLQIPAATRCAATAMLLVYIPSWRFARDGGSTTPMVLCTLLSFYFLLKWNEDPNTNHQAPPRASNTANRDLWLCGIFAGAAFCMRYAGLFFIASLGILLAIDWLRKRTWASIRNLIHVITPIVLIISVVLGRNVYHVNSLFGRPKSTVNVARPLTEQVTWTISLLTGISRSAISDANPIAIIAAIAVVVSVPLCFPGILTARPNQRSAAQFSAAELPFIYSVFSIVSLIGCSAAFQFGFVQPRYLVAIVPFVLIVLTDALNRVRNRHPDRIASWVPMLLLLLCFVGQFRTYWYPDKSSLRNEAIRNELLASAGEFTVEDLLKKGTTSARPLFTDSPQEIALVIDRPTIGIATADFSRQQLTANSAQQMMKSFGARRIFVLKALFDETEPTRSNQMFFAELKNGRIPRWLKTIYSDKNVGIYQRIDGAASLD